MEKRVLLAFALATLVLSVWPFLGRLIAPPPEHNQAQEIQKQAEKSASAPVPDVKTSPPATSMPAEGAPTTLPAATAQPLRELVVETPYWKARFTNQGGVATHWTISRLHDGNGQQLMGHDGRELELVPQMPEIISKMGAPFALMTQDPLLDQQLRTANFEINTDLPRLRIDPGSSKEVVFTFSDPASQLLVTKKFIFNGDKYDFDFYAEAHLRGAPVNLRVLLGPSFADQSVKETGAYLTPPIAVAQHAAGSVERLAADKESNEHLAGAFAWAGVEDNYFALLATGKERFEGLDVLRHAVKDKVGEDEITRHFIAMAVPMRAGAKYLIFAGPKDPEILRSVDLRAGGVGLENAINYGMLASVVRPVVDYVLLPVLNFTYRYVHNYGLAIIVITFLINMFFFPLKWKSTLKMRQAAVHQPRMKELQDRIKSLKKDDPQLQALQLEQVKLMKEANPLGGCLPMLLQLPIFWAFYTLLTVSIDVRHAHFFGWIDNLSAPDRFHILPVVMCLSMMAQSAMMPTMAAQSNPSQKIMMYVMPVMLTALFFWSAPSGLVLYWLFSNLVGAGQQLVINKLNPPPPPAPEPSTAKQKKRTA